MSGVLKFFAVAAVAAACAAPAAAAGFNGGGDPAGFGGVPSSGAAPPSPRGGGDVGPRVPSGPNRAPAGVLPPNPGSPNSDFRPLRHGARQGFAGRGYGGGDWRQRPRHYWFGGGPFFVPDPSGDYVYGDDDYDDGSDPTGCRVYRKAFDRTGRFLGFVPLDQCEGR